MKIVLQQRTGEGSPPDMLVDLPSAATVADLKEAVRSSHLARPPAIEQKLIYGGRLLNDETAKLTDILSLSFDRSDVDREYKFWLLLPKAIAAVLASPKSPLMSGQRVSFDLRPGSPDPIPADVLGAVSNVESGQAACASLPELPPSVAGSSGTNGVGAESSRRRRRHRSSVDQSGSAEHGEGDVPSPAAPASRPLLAPAPASSHARSRSSMDMDGEGEGVGDGEGEAVRESRDRERHRRERASPTFPQLPISPATTRSTPPLCSPTPVAQTVPTGAPTGAFLPPNLHIHAPSMSPRLPTMPMPFPVGMSAPSPVFMGIGGLAGMGMGMPPRSPALVQQSPGGSFLMAALMQHNEALQAQITSLQLQQQHVLASANMAAMNAAAAAASAGLPSPMMPPMSPMLMPGTPLGMSMGPMQWPMGHMTMPPPGATGIPMMSLDAAAESPRGIAERSRSGVRDHDREGRASGRRSKRASAADEGEARGERESSHRAQRGEEDGAGLDPIAMARSSSGPMEPERARERTSARRRHRRSMDIEHGTGGGEEVGTGGEVEAGHGGHGVRRRLYAGPDQEGGGGAEAERAAVPAGIEAANAGAGEGVGAAEDGAVAVGAEGAEQQPEAPPQGLRRFIDIGLAFRLAMLSFMFTQGASQDRIRNVAACLLCVYLLRVGIFALVWEGLKARTAWCRRLATGRAAAQELAAGPVGPDAAVAPVAAVHVPAAAFQTPHAAVTAWLMMGRGYFICDILALAASLAVSLIPTWVPDDEFRPYLRRERQ